MFIICDGIYKILFDFIGFCINQFLQYIYIFRIARIFYFIVYYLIIYFIERCININKFCLFLIYKYTNTKYTLTQSYIMFWFILLIKLCILFVVCKLCVLCYSQINNIIVYVICYHGNFYVKMIIHIYAYQARRLRTSFREAP